MWVVFDQVRLEDPDGAMLALNDEVFIRGAKPAAYELSTGEENVQPLLVDIEHPKR